MKFYYNTEYIILSLNLIGINPSRRTVNLSSDTNDMMSLQKVTSFISIADLLLTWQHLTTMNIAIAN